MNVEDAVLSKEMKEKGRETKEQTTIVIRKGDAKCWADLREKEGTSRQETQVH